MACLAVDFDGTCVLHEYPDVGADVPHAVRTLKDLVKQGHQLILWTMRSNLDPKKPDHMMPRGMFLDDAINWFNKNEIQLFGIQENPRQFEWTSSNKAYANIYIDDAGFGAPLIHPKEGRPYLDWLKVREYFELGE